MEQAIPTRYLRRLNQLYTEWIQSYDLSPLIEIESDRVDYVTEQFIDLLGCDPDDILKVSAKTGEGIEELKRLMADVAPDDFFQPAIIGDLLNPGDIAILFRTRTGLDTYEDALRRHRIPYYLAGDAGLTERQELADIFGIGVQPVYVKTHDSVYLNVMLREAAIRKLDVAMRERGWRRRRAPELLEAGGGWHSDRRPERAYTPDQAARIVAFMRRHAGDEQAADVAQLSGCRACA